MVQEQKLVTHNHPHTHTHTHTRTHTHTHTQTLLPASCSSLIWLFNCGAFTCQGLIDNTAAGFICLMKKKKNCIYIVNIVFLYFFFAGQKSVITWFCWWNFSKVLFLQVTKVFFSIIILEPYHFGQRVYRTLRFPNGGESIRHCGAVWNISYDCAKSEPFSHRAVEPVRL